MAGCVNLAPLGVRYLTCSTEASGHLCAENDTTVYAFYCFLAYAFQVPSFRNALYRHGMNQSLGLGYSPRSVALFAQTFT